MRAVAESPATTTLNARGYTTLMAVARITGWRAGWDTMTSRPTRAAAADASGCSQRTVTRWWRWLEEHGFLRVLEPGTLPQFRPAILHSGDGPLAREFLLTLPVHRSVTPICTNQKPPGAREPRTTCEGKPAPADPIAALRQSSVTLRRIRPVTLAKLAAPFLVAGWTTRDLLHSLDRLPDGGVHWHTSQVRYPAAWARNRWACWMGEDGRPVPSRAAQLAAIAVEDRARQAADRDARAPSGPPATPGAVHAAAAAARTLIAARSDRAASVIRQARMSATPW